jgi:hypothetical protein
MVATSEEAFEHWRYPPGVSRDTQAAARELARQLTIPRGRLRVVMDCTFRVNLVRARCNLAFTVPTGNSRIFAVSLADNSCTPRKCRTST